MRKLILISGILLSLVIIQSCCSFQGSHDLGNNFILMEGDADKQEIIVFCSPKRTGCCKGGAQIIPSLDDYYNGDYVSDMEFDNNWIIVNVTNKEGTRQEAQYWIIDKDFELEERFKDWPMEEDVSNDFDSLIQSKITGPLNLEMFNQKRKELKIYINFE